MSAADRNSHLYKIKSTTKSGIGAPPMKTLSKAAARRLRHGYDNLRARAEAGDQLVSWILVILAVIAIALIVVAAVNGWFAGRIGELGT